jgi:predicted transcriptional regulator
MAQQQATQLSRRERQIMDIVYRLGSATASEVTAESRSAQLLGRPRHAPHPRGQGAP